MNQTGPAYRESVDGIESCQYRLLNSLIILQITWPVLI